MGKNIFSSEHEKEIQKIWEKEGVDKYDEESNKPIYSVDSPPPTISGEIHMGHVFSYTQMEVVARFKKMLGYNLFYPFGFDDNGIPTEVLVEKETGKKSREVGREKFTQECFKTTKYYRDKFKNMWKSLGLGVDWGLEYSTISPEVQKISQKSFIKLLNEGAIYKADAPSFWCTQARTSVAQSELEYEEKDGVFYDISFEVESGDSLTIGTTRPELLSACVAVFVHPKDDRYKKFIGKNITTPLGDTVEIIGDDKVDMEKGTGVVMCCTYGDETDLYWVRKHNLSDKVIVGQDGLIQDGPAKGLHVKKSRKNIVEYLKEKGAITKEEEITHSVAVFERTKNPIEIISVPQWFVKVLEKKERIKELGNKMKWHPQSMKKRFDHWVDNLEIDWNISRQRYFGIPVPVWYSKKTGEIILPDESQLPINPLTDIPNNLPEGHTKDDIAPESEVLDTWATSSLTPFINAKWGEDNSMEDKLLPMNLRTQAHDIIRTWTFGSVVMSMYHKDDIPFENVMISGHMVAKGGEKISKSKGNAGKSPEEYIETYGADAVRYRTCGGILGRDLALDENEIKKGRKLVTKLLNSAKFVFMNLEDFDVFENVEFNDLEEIDRKIISKIKTVSSKVAQHFEKFEFLYARKEFEDFFWNDFCDNYLEIVKSIIYNPKQYEDGEQKKKSAQYTLYYCMNKIIKLIAPVQPHISEYLYQTYYKDTEGVNSIHNTRFPGYDNLNKITEENFEDLEGLYSIIGLIRQYKTLEGIKLGEQVDCIEISAKKEDIDVYRKYFEYIKSVGKSKNIKFIKNSEKSINIK